MKCDSCHVEIAEGARFCPLCGKGKEVFHVECPYCGKRMEKGLAQIHSSFFQMLLTGLGSQSLFFKKNDGTEMKILTSRAEQEAFHCKNCDSIFILPQ